MIRRVAERIAIAFLAGPWEVDGMLRRAKRVVEGSRRWLGRLARKIHAKGAGQGALRRRLVTEWILQDPTFVRAYERYDVDVAVRAWGQPAPMAPAEGAPASWRLPLITTDAQLAEWLGIRHSELEWFAGRCGRRQPMCVGPLAHYRYRAIKKRHGEIRLLEIPSRTTCVGTPRGVFHDWHQRFAGAAHGRLHTTNGPRAKVQY